MLTRVLGIMVLHATIPCLQDERKQLQHALRDFEITAQARREAERRVKELEAGITALKDRAQHMMKELTTQR
jgi:hypothetical protein